MILALHGLQPDVDKEHARIAFQLPNLEEAWQLKEALRTWYSTDTTEIAEEQLETWMNNIQTRGPDVMRQALVALPNGNRKF